MVEATVAEAEEEAAVEIGQPVSYATSMSMMHSTASIDLIRILSNSCLINNPPIMLPIQVLLNLRIHLPM